MALPKIDLPLFSLTLPSNNEKVMFRPFKVKEEKMLLVAQESKDVEQAILAIKQVVNNCMQEKDIDTLAMLDLEYILLELRSRSVDNAINFVIKDEDTDEEVKLSLDLSNVSVKRDPAHTNKIKVNDDYTMFMRQPTINEFLMLAKNGNDKQTQYNIMLACIDKLASDEEVHEMSELSVEEIEQFVDDLEGTVVDKMMDFFKTIPKLRHEIKYKNSQGTEKTFVIEGIDAFFI